MEGHEVQSTRVCGEQVCFVASENPLRRDAYKEFVELRAAKLAEQFRQFEERVEFGGKYEAALESYC